MSKVEVPILESTVQKTHIWLKDLSNLMGWEDQHLAYISLRAVLHALRDRLPVEVVAKLGAQLPLLIRGIFYEGWVPSQTPIKIHHLDEFLILITTNLNHTLLIPETTRITLNVFKVMRNHLTEGEINQLKKVLPGSIAKLFSE